MALAGASPQLIAGRCSGAGTLLATWSTPHPQTTCYGEESGLGYDGIGPTGIIRDRRGDILDPFYLPEGTYAFHTTLLSNCGAMKAAEDLRLRAGSLDTAASLADYLAKATLATFLRIRHPGAAAAVLAVNMAGQLSEWLRGKDLQRQANAIDHLLDTDMRSVLGIALFSERETINGRGGELLATQADFFPEPKIPIP